jgi:hypothetical protein
MRVMEVVRKKADRAGAEVYGKVMAVRGLPSNTITVQWEDGQMSDHPREDLVLVNSPFRDVAHLN